jgi:hypothetical protein
MTVVSWVSRARGPYIREGAGNCGGEVALVVVVVVECFVLRDRDFVDAAPEPAKVPGLE